MRRREQHGLLLTEGFRPKAPSVISVSQIRWGGAMMPARSPGGRRGRHTGRLGQKDSNLRMAESNRLMI
jgi:hypothetical protein